VGNNAIVGSGLSVGDNAVIGNSLGVGNNAVIGSNLSVGTNAVIGNNLFVGNNTQIGGNLVVAGLITAGNLNTNTVGTTTIVANSVTLTGTMSSVTDFGRSGRQLTYVGTDGIFYYWADPIPLYANVVTSNLVTTTSSVLNTIQGEISLKGLIIANVDLSPYVNAYLNRISYTASTISTLAGGTVQQSPVTLLAANVAQPLTQTLFAEKFVSVTNNAYTAAATPETIAYIWSYQAAAITTTFPANVYVFYSNVTGQSMTVTNLKR
jgi:hypothetical protein